jgi:hypothetical protein
MYWPYIQDSKLEGVRPSVGRKLYLVWNQVVGRNGKEKTLDRAKQGTRWGVGVRKMMRFQWSNVKFEEKRYVIGAVGKAGKSGFVIYCTHIGAITKY